MTTLTAAGRHRTTHPMSDTSAMLGRRLIHMRRDPSQVVVVTALPIIFLLLFVYVFGNTLGSGIGVSGTSGYLNYVMPGLLALGVAAGAQGTSVAVHTDMTEGIIARFRTMAISRGAVLAGHVLSAMIQVTVGLVGVVALSLLLGYRPSAGVTDWLGAIGVLFMIVFSLSWLAVALGMFANSTVVASNMPMPLVLLPFLGSGFVPADSMPAGLRWFSQYQPFTPFVESLRGLLDGAPTGSSILTTAVWCAAIAAVGYVWALVQYDRKSVR